MNKPTNIDSKSLFEFTVNILIQKISSYYSKYPIINKYLTHLQWTNIIFGVANSTNNSLLSQVARDYNFYLIRQGNKYKWNIRKIFEEHPDFFEDSEKNTSQNDLNIFQELEIALNDEIYISKKNTQKNTFNISNLGTIRIDKHTEIYLTEIIIEEDDDPKLFEGLPFIIKIGGLSFDAVILDFDKLKNIVYFDSPYPLLKYQGTKRLIIDSSWLLEKLKERIIDFKNSKFETKPINKLLLKQYYPSKIHTPAFDPLSYEKFFNKNDILDNSQKDAFHNSIENDITLIWGPPGTGKSHTLSRILYHFLRKNEKTVVCCIANVALDSLILKFTELLELLEKNNLLQKEYKNDSILRLGHTRNIDVLEKDFIFPKNFKIDKLRDEITELKKSLLSPDIEEIVKISKLKEIKDKGEDLKKEIDSLIFNAKIIFTTISKFHVDNSLNQLDFDNLVIDEASMVSVPHFIALTKEVNQRLIIAGDFRQLGPVVLSQTGLSQKWLHQDIFEFGGINQRNAQLDSSLLSQLLIQRRSHESICYLINRPFYQNKLISNSAFDNSKIINSEPFKGKVINYFELSNEKLFQVSRTKKGSRFNMYSAFVIIQVLEVYFKLNSQFQIGVITPYRGQVRQINDLLLKSEFSKKFKENLKIGTIHSFQGSEADIIILDLVDSKHEKIGRLFCHDQGKRLVNVAISRAKSKLIVVGDANIFSSGLGNNNIDDSVKWIMNKISKSR
ncbi:ATP-binding protein [Lacihabitans sp. CCS-44]|uniref:DEAD/DEAH box helicase n=1 Tax=Lacihabitans sp. CCS-44 TaxID=2487331 RepID=UPI0020CD1642|nr:AAA domain-containing protein [Lacihabitans sp. CCS-44]